VSFSAGYVGLPGQEGALVPGQDYTAVVGEDLCALGKSFADVLNAGVGSGEVAMLGGTPGNALTLGWQRCATAALADGVDLVNPPADENSTTGDVLGEHVRARRRSWPHHQPDKAGPTNTRRLTPTAGMSELNIGEEPHRRAHRPADLFCTGRNAEPTYNICTRPVELPVPVAPRCSPSKVPGSGQVVVPHVMRQVTASDCNPNRVNEVVSGTSLVPDNVLAEMFGG
jgi:hypothetical protein